MINVSVKNRIDLAKYFKKKRFKKGAEIGVHEGRYSEILCQKIPGLKLLCVDIWPKDSIYQTAKKRLAKYKIKLVRKNSMEAVKSVPNESLDFVFIDGDHKYESVKSDIEKWSKKVKKGGIISGHDYYIFHFSRNRGVIEAVDEYVNKHKFRLYVTKYGPRGLSREDRIPIWYFFKKPKRSNP